MSSTPNQPALVPDTTALAPTATPGALEVARTDERHGLLALGRLDDAEFRQQLDTLKRGMERLDTIIRDVLKEGLDADYAVLPGTTKKDLLLPGAEKLLFMTRLVPEYRLERVAGAGEPGSPRIHYTCHCLLHLGDLSGPTVSAGLGTANSNEVKHRYRSADRECPSCHKTGTILRSKFEAKKGAWVGKKGWYCYAKQGGCGAEFAPDDPAVTFQTLGRVENTEPDDLDNTLAKMSKTRAVKDATKTALGGSARFTQDVTESKARVDPDAGRQVREVEADEPVATQPPDDGGVTPTGEVRLMDRGSLITALTNEAQARGLKFDGLVATMQRLALLPTPAAPGLRFGDLSYEQLSSMYLHWTGVEPTSRETKTAPPPATQGTADNDIPF